MEDEILNQIAQEIFRKDYEELSEEEQDCVWERMDDRGLTWRWKK